MITSIQAQDSREMGIEPSRVWEVLADVKRAELWWPKQLRLKVKKVSIDLVGSEFEVWPKGGRRFQCRIVAVEPPLRMKTEYFGTFIKGTGIWRVEKTSNGCIVSYELDVGAKGLLVAIIARFVSLSKIHSQLMVKVLESLEREVLKSRLGLT